MRTRPADKPKLGALVPVIEAILEADRAGPPKQQHTAKRIFERLRDEHGYGGGYAVVKGHVRRQRVAEQRSLVRCATCGMALISRSLATTFLVQTHVASQRNLLWPLSVRLYQVQRRRWDCRYFRVLSVMRERKDLPYGSKESAVHLG